MKRKQKKHWTKERCIKIISKYKSIKALRINNHKCLSIVYINKWNFLLKNLIRKSSQTYWTKERCKKESLKYKTRRDFQKKSNTAYAISCKNNWLNNFKNLKLLNKKWKDASKKECFKKAKLCKSKVEFRNKYNFEYRASLRNNWLNNFKHFKRASPANFKWTKKFLQKEALKYYGKKEFEKGSNSAYNIALSKGLINEICKHMTPKGHKYKRCIYVYEFSDNFVYVGLTHDINERNTTHLRQGPVYYHIKKTKLLPILKQLTKYISVEKAIQAEGYWQRKYKREGYFSLHKIAPGGLGGGFTLKYVS